ncbi:AAA family ATPase [Nocardia paucivorans]|uniref:AAA family ATPase n=1 Tax=Nocardia paucivorans TaxID=114259 RepID=UPI0003028AE4|nr:SMC family ATPase [Nocardia paucivorans]
MRLHRLEMTAFGPFAEPTAVDFDVLGADGLFLLHGQTGAGKTTVLDAIAFALYGRVPGARGDKRLHSDHASPQTPPRVMLEATLGGRRVRLTRSPEFERPKLRGTGTRIEQPKATLTWLDGQGRNLSRIPDIGEEVKRLLGMSADQFFQVVLLPQGDFARFLRAENEDREKLLEKLFDTERFGAAEQWLADQRRASETKLSDQLRNVQNLITRIGVTAGIGTTETVGPLEAAEWSQELLATARRELDAATAELELRRKESAAADERAESERRLADLRRRLDAARRRLADYTAGAEQRAAVRGELDRAHRAEPVAAALDEARAAVETARRRDGDAARARARLTDLLAEPASADIPGGELVPAASGPVAPASGAPEPGSDVALDLAIRRWSTLLGTVTQVRSDAATAARLTGELTELRDTDTALRARVAELTRRRAELPAAIAAAEVRVREAAEANAALPGLAAECDRLRVAASAAVDLAGRRTELDRARIELDSARAAHLDARERVLRLRERRLAGMAAELAGQLVAGRPCGVCGSLEHPAPARPTEDAVSKDAEDAAVAEERAAEETRDRVLGRIADLERDIEALTARGGDTDQVELAAALRAATERYDDADDLAGHADEWNAELTRLRTDENRLHEELRDCETERGAVATRIAATETRLRELDERLREAAGADGAIERRIGRLNTLVTVATAWRDARTAARTAWEHVAALAERVEKLAEAAGFAPVDPVERDGESAEVGVERALAVFRSYAPVIAEATRSKQWCVDTEAALLAAEHERAHAEAVLAEPEIEAAAATEPADLPALEAAVRSARAALDEAVADRAAAAERVTGLEELSGQLWAAVDLIAPAQRRHEELAGLAEVVAGRGANNRRMSLRSYVLAARLEEVALAGSVRLRRMSGGRYEFVHSDKAGPRGRRGGLGLDIRDDYTGAIRPARTLSGGETFMASLSLALGLADTVTAESGGVALDTLFIDEGFGSLDTDTLDAVMGVLDDLRAGGRVVGIVSHVDEMRQRIPSRLHVVRGRNGSHLRTTVA